MYDIVRQRTKKERQAFIEGVSVTTKDTGVSYKCSVVDCDVLYNAIDKKLKDKFKRDGHHKH